MKWFVAVLWLSISGPALAEEFGGIEGQFLFEGPLPAVKPVGGAGVCGPAGVPDESLVVNPQNRGIANLFVYLRKGPKVLPHALQASKTKEVILDNKGCQFVPHAAIVRTDQKLRFTSADPFPHNIHTFTLSVGNPQQNFLLQANDVRGTAIEFKASETLPMPVKCDIHPWMRGTVLVLDHPYAAVTDADGKFRIEGLPAGEHSFRVWHEIPGYLEREWKIQVVGGQTTAIPPVSVPAARLAEKKS